MKILINERLSKHRCKTPEGYLICTDAILARTGKQTYRKNEIFKDSDDETEIEVDRTEDEVFAPQTLASFENKPVTVEHPDEDVNVHNYKEYAVGFVRDVHRGEVDGQPVILGNLVITDEQTIQEIENGEHTDLSCGYDCDIADEPNPCQRNIRGNHVALCEQGRAGIARIVDSTHDVNHLPAKVKHDLQKFLNHKSTFIRNKDYDISEFVKEFERVSRLWVEFPLKIVRESIKGWFKTGDGMMRKDYTFSIEGYDDHFMVSLYAKPETYETTELNAYFTDSVKDQHSVFTEGFRELDPSEVKEILIKRKNGKSYPELVDEYKDIRSSTLLALIENFDKGYIKLNDLMLDARMKVANLTNGYAIVPTSRWRKFGLNAEVERFTTNLDEARYIRSSLERNDGISFVIVDVTQRRTTDSMKDAWNINDDVYVNVGDGIYHHAKLISKEGNGAFNTCVVKDLVTGKTIKTIMNRLRLFTKDSMKDALIPPTKEAINKFESLLRIFDIKIDRKGLTPLGRVHYQVRANMEFDRFVKTLERIDDEMNKLGIPMTFNAGSDGKTCTAGIDLDKQYVKDSQRAQKIQKIIKVVKSIK